MLRLNGIRFAIAVFGAGTLLGVGAVAAHSESDGAQGSHLAATSGGMEAGRCRVDGSVDLGSFGAAPVSVPDNACVVVTRFAKPNFVYGPARTMQLQNPAGSTDYPLNYSYFQDCTPAAGTGTIDRVWQDQYVPNVSDECPLFLKLAGDGKGTVDLAYF